MIVLRTKLFIYLFYSGFWTLLNSFKHSVVFLNIHKYFFYVLHYHSFEPATTGYLRSTCALYRIPCSTPYCNNSCSWRRMVLTMNYSVSIIYLSNICWKFAPWQCCLVMKCACFTLTIFLTATFRVIYNPITIRNHYCSEQLPLAVCLVFYVPDTSLVAIHKP